MNGRDARPATTPPALVAALLSAAAESKSGTFVVHVGESPTRLAMLRGTLLLVGDEAFQDAIVCVAARGAPWAFEASVDADSLTNGVPTSIEALLRAAATGPDRVAPAMKSLIVVTPSRALAAAALKRLHESVRSRQLQNTVSPREREADLVATMGSPVPKKRVLIVEDDAATLAMMTRALSTAFEVAEAKTGFDALTLLGSAPAPAVVLLDVALPGVDGVTVARKLKAEARLKEVPVVFVSAKTSPADVLLGIAAGAKHYLTKPFSVAALLELVERLAR